MNAQDMANASYLRDRRAKETLLAIGRVEERLDGAYSKLVIVICLAGFIACFIGGFLGNLVAWGMK